jgi:tRNA nucleotidyltransferase (CCA-adding enzyme)
LRVRLGAPTAGRPLAELTAREHGNVHRSGEFGAAALVRLLERCDALRRPERFAELLLACECDARGRLGLEDQPYPQRARLTEALRQVAAVDTTAVAAAASARGATGPAIGQAIHAARVEALRDLGLPPEAPSE